MDWDVLYRALVLRYKVHYNPGMLVWHDGWESREERDRKTREREPARMAADIIAWFSVGGPALRGALADLLRSLCMGPAFALRGHRGLSKYFFARTVRLASGIPLGIRLGIEQRVRPHLSKGEKLDAP
jgi:GT2 family glycosyltransferase